jgi:hypothetical protein
MTKIRITSTKGTTASIDFPLPAALDPRFDFLKTDGELKQLAEKRMSLANQIVAGTQHAVDFKSLKIVPEYDDSIVGDDSQYKVERI